jgi:two-component system sensor histidine kinase ChiS
MIALALLVSLAAVDAPPVVEVRTLRSETSLAGKWRFAPGDDMARASPDFDDSAWDLLDVPRGLGGQLGGKYRALTGMYWYRLTLKVPPARGNDLPGFEVGNVDSAYELYVDGSYIGGRGSVVAPNVVEPSRPAIWRLPAAAFEDGEIVIALRGWRSEERASARPDRGGMTHPRVRLGQVDELARAAIITQLDEIVLTSVFIVVGLYHLNLFMRRRALREYFWFGLLSLLIGIYVVMNADITHGLTSFVVGDKIAYFCIFTIMPVIVQFLWPFLGQPLRWWWRVYQAFCVSWTAVAMLWPSMWFANRFLVFWEVVALLPLMVMVIALIARRVWAGDPEARTIAIGMGALILTAANNIGRSLGWQTPEVTNWAFAMFVLSMAVSLSNRFTRVYGELDLKNHELVKMDKLKDEFLANTSHELRTPIHGIIGLADSLADGATGPLPAATVENLRMIVSSGERLSGLVNDILDFSKLRGGQLELTTGPVDLHAAVDIVLRLSKPLADKKGLTLTSEVPRDIPPAKADEHRLQQILFNLVGNGLKFTENGGVTVRARVDGAVLRVDVIDTGIGVDPKDHARIFESFQQADGSSSREYGGTGLGLTVTRKLVELHSGTISLESAKGKGSTFSFTLPVDTSGASLVALKPRTVVLPQVPMGLPPSSQDSAASVPATPAAVPRPTGQQRFKVLVVDDEPVNVKVLENHLSLSDYEVARAASGHEALALVEKGFKPDLILLDVMMPRMSGFEVCQTLREKYPATELPVVLVTAKNQVADVMAGFEAGANDYLTKPVAKNELLARIRTHLHVAKMNLATARFVPYEFLSLLGKETLIDVRKGDQVAREMSVLFSDIRGFTTLVEKKTPAENFAFINAYLEHMEPAITENGGFVDSFIGDAIMALFEGGASTALRAGIAMQRRMPSFNEVRARRGEEPIKIGIGLNTGQLMLGTIGGHTHIKCGVIGDCVNLASRIEGMTKMYGATLLISDTTRAGLDDATLASVSLREVDKVAAKGKAKPVTIYEVIDADEDSVRDVKLKQVARYTEALAQYRARAFAEAAQAFEALAREAPVDVVLAIYAERARRHRDTPPPASWDGVEKLDTK